MRRVSKRYPGTLAVDRVDFQAYSGEVHALMGENGAGKSTLMKMLAGSFADYEGQIEINGAPVELRSPLSAKSNGIEMIYQELSLAQPISIAENILAGRLPTKRRWFLDRNRLAEESRKWLSRVGLEHIDPFAPVESLSQHEAQLVEIAKALSNHPSILIMDEPTSSLSRKEVDTLFEIISDLKNQGLAIVYISHHIPEIFECCDRVTILRDGKNVESAAIEKLTAQGIVEQMVGRSVSEQSPAKSVDRGPLQLSVDALSRFGFFHEVSLQVHSGEVLGIAGLAGSGRTELGRSIAGLDPIDLGTITIEQQNVSEAGIRHRLEQGIAYLTEDRKLLGLALELDLATNLSSALNVQQSRRASAAQIKNAFQDQADQLQIYPREIARQVSQFSGGNQQKILLAKWLATKPKVLILDEPTRGVDIGAKEIIHETILKSVKEGMSVLLISSDLPELIRLSNRVLVLRRGRVFKELTQSELNENAILLAANGEEISA